MSNNEVREQIRTEIERETRISRYRDRLSHERIHPSQHDVRCLQDFVLGRRLRQPGALDAVRRTLKAVDTEALRMLTAMVQKGSSTRAIRRCCERVNSHCDTIEQALAQREGIRVERAVNTPIH